jgi:beta-lactamase class D
MDQSKDFRFGLKSKSLQSKLKAIFDVIKGWWVGGWVRGWDKNLYALIRDLEKVENKNKKKRHKKQVVELL